MQLYGSLSILWHCLSLELDFPGGSDGKASAYNEGDQGLIPGLGRSASGGDGIPVELFQILKDDAVKVLHSICQQIWKAQQWPQHWKRSVFIPVPKK